MSFSASLAKNRTLYSAGAVHRGVSALASSRVARPAARAAVALRTKTPHSHFHRSAGRLQEFDWVRDLNIKSDVSREPTVMNTPISKVIGTPAEAISLIKFGDTIALSGFGAAGAPFTLSEALLARGKEQVKDLWVVSNNPHIQTTSRLIEAEMVAGITSSHLMYNKHIEQLYITGKLELELTPQGNIAERCRAAGAGIPAFYTPTGYGTWVQEGKIPIKYDAEGNPVKYPEPREVREFNGKQYVLEKAIEPDVSLIHAWKADPYGNCVFRYTSSNHCGPMGRAGKVTIVEAEHIVPVGAIDPNDVDLPGSYVNTVVQAVAPLFVDVPKVRTLEDPTAESEEPVSLDARNRIARRVAQVLEPGTTVNLGIGMPTLVANHLGGKIIHFQSENGLVGIGPYPTNFFEYDPDVTNAGKESVTLAPGASTFDSAESFGLIRSGTVSASILGALQVSQNGDLANFFIPGKMVAGMGGAMDLVSNPDKTQVIVTTTHTDKHGNSKIVKECEFPLTGPRCVSRIVSDLAHFLVDRHNGGLTLIETAEGVTVDEIRAKTEADFTVADNLGTF